MLDWQNCPQSHAVVHHCKPCAPLEWSSEVKYRFQQIISTNLPAVGPEYFKDQEDLKTALAFSKMIHSGVIAPYLENKPPVKIHPARLEY